MERIRSFMTKKDLLVFLSLFIVSFTTTLIGLSIREDYIPVMHIVTEVCVWSSYIVMELNLTYLLFTFADDAHRLNSMFRYARNKANIKLIVYEICFLNVIMFACLALLLLLQSLETEILQAIVISIISGAWPIIILCILSFNNYIIHGFRKTIHGKVLNGDKGIYNA